MSPLNLQFLSAFLGKLSNREKLVFYSAVFFVSLTILDRLVVNPVFSKIQDLGQEIQETNLNIREFGKQKLDLSYRHEAAGRKGKGHFQAIYNKPER
jgi:type II secretory pathway component PulM